MQLLAAARVPGVDQLLGTSADPALLVLADAGDGPTLADRYCEILADERKETASAFWRRANASFASCGVTVKRVLTDNGPRTARRLSLTRSVTWCTSGPGRTGPRPT